MQFLQESINSESSKRSSGGYPVKPSSGVTKIFASLIHAFFASDKIKVLL